MAVATEDVSGEALVRVGAEQIAARIEQLPYSNWHVWVLGTVGLAAFFDAFDALTIAFVLPVLATAWKIAPDQIGYLISSGYVGQLIGAIWLSAVAERLGRVRMLQVSIAILGVLSLACALAANYPTFLGLRLVQGIGLGAEIPIAATYISEVCPGRFRGRMVFLLNVVFGFGIMVTSLVAIWLIPNLGWQSMFLIGGLPIILAVILPRLIPESPRWLAEHRSVEAADRAMSRIEKAVYLKGLKPIPPATPTSQLTQKTGKATLVNLFQDGYAGRTSVVWVIMFSTSVTGYGLLSWMPTIYKTVYHVSLQQALIYSFIASVAAMFSGFLGAWVIEIIGRRWTYFIGFVGAAIPLLLLWANPSVGVVTVVALATTAYFFVTILLAGLYAYVGEIYPTRMRALGVGVASSWFRIANIVGPTIVGLLLAANGISSVYAFFGLTASVGAAVVFIFLIETRGRPLEEIAY